MNKPNTVHEKTEDYGIDVSLIRSNLRLTPSQRLRRHDRALNTINKLRAAMDKKRE